MAWRTIDPEQWPAFLRGFGERHQRWLVQISGTLDTPAGYVPLRELRLAEGGGDDGDLVILVGSDEQPTQLRFRGPRTVRVDMNLEAVERALTIEGRGGELTLRFRTAIAPELVDGPPP